MPLYAHMDVYMSACATNAWACGRRRVGTCICMDVWVCLYAGVTQCSVSRAKVGRIMGAMTHFNARF